MSDVFQVVVTIQNYEKQPPPPPSHLVRPRGRGRRHLPPQVNLSPFQGFHRARI